VSLSGKRILLGVTGGIAAYKSAVLLRELQKSGAEVRCIMTPSALRFIGRDTLSALSRQPVPVEVFPNDADIADSWTRHIHWAEWADALLIAPCTANTLAKIVHGLSDNMLTSTVLAARCPVVICPTMDGGMYESPATLENRKKAIEFGFHIIEPEHGYLASGLEDKGRLPESSEILQKMDSILSGSGFLSGKKVVITAGPTREFLDAVRFISNPSSGKMGFAMAEAARNAGAEVTLIHGPVNLPKLSGVKQIPIISADDLFENVKKVADADIFILAAAVSDFKPETRVSHKVKKDSAEPSISLVRTPDTLLWLGENKKAHQTIIGFAMETERVIEQATEKLNKKNADWIIANSLSDKNTGFETDTNTVHLIGTKNAETRTYTGSKKVVAENCLKAIFS
jgi:phosphopantothenoylcysteine decarboxylase/phosphopantothenate--cysteine ligase